MVVSTIIGTTLKVAYKTTAFVGKGLYKGTKAVTKTVYKRLKRKPIKGTKKRKSTKGTKKRKSTK